MIAKPFIFEETSILGKTGTFIALITIIARLSSWAFGKNRAKASSFSLPCTPPPGFFLFLLFSSTFLLAPLEQARANATPDQNYFLRLKHELFASGFHLADLVTEMTVEKNRYKIVMKAESKGVLFLTSRWQSLYETKGVVIGNRLVPEKHRTMETKIGKDRYYAVNFTRDGPQSWLYLQGDEAIKTFLASRPEVLPQTPSNSSDPFFKPTIMRNAIDWGSLLTQLSIDANLLKDCRQSSYKAFNGRFLFSFKLDAPQQAGKISAPPRGIYTQTSARRCAQNFSYLSSPERNKNTPKNDTQPVVWFDRMKEKEPMVMVHGIFPSRHNKGVALLYLEEYEYKKI